MTAPPAVDSDVDINFEAAYDCMLHQIVLPHDTSAMDDSTMDDAMPTVQY